MKPNKNSIKPKPEPLTVYGRAEGILKDYERYKDKTDAVEAIVKAMLQEREAGKAVIREDIKEILKNNNIIKDI